jgi:hypothetical protein
MGELGIDGVEADGVHHHPHQFCGSHRRRHRGIDAETEDTLTRSSPRSTS